MRQSENLIQTLDKFQTAVYLKDLHGRYLSMNSTGLKYMKSHPAGILGRTAHDLFDLSSADAMVRNDQHVMHSNHIHTANFNTSDKQSGAAIQMFSAKTAIYTPSGQPLGVVGISLMDCKDAVLFSEVCRLLPQFVKKKHPRLLSELLELRTVAEFLRTHRLQSYH